MTRFIEVNTAKGILWNHARISADDYRLVVRMMFEKSIEVEKVDEIPTVIEAEGE